MNFAQKVRFGLWFSWGACSLSWLSLVIDKKHLFVCDVVIAQVGGFTLASFGMMVDSKLKNII